MMRRRRGRGIVGTMATTAVVVGTAGAVSHRQQSKYQAQAANQQAATAEQQQMAEMQAQMAAMQAQQAAGAAGAAPAGGADVMAQLQQLSEMKNAGVLTDAQFEAAKSKLLGV